LAAYPLEVHARPGGFPFVATAIPEQKLRELMARDTLGFLGIVAGALEIAHRLGGRFGHMDFGEIAASQEAASFTASRRSVLTRSPAVFGTSEGAMTTQSMPAATRAR
jgi:hypothetical protein